MSCGDFVTILTITILERQILGLGLDALEVDLAQAGDFGVQLGLELLIRFRDEKLTTITGLRCRITFDTFGLKKFWETQAGVGDEELTLLQCGIAHFGICVFRCLPPHCLLLRGRLGVGW